MKKLITLALVGAVLTGVAFASSLSVPFFNDRGDLGAGNNLTAFIGLKNTTDQPVELGIRYFTAAGVEMTPDDNSFTLNPQQGISWRPYRVDSGFEGADAAAIPVMPGQPADGAGAGSATIFWHGEPHWVQGRMTQYLSDGGWSAYLLPAGVAQ